MEQIPTGFPIPLSPAIISGLVLFFGVLVLVWGTYGITRLLLGRLSGGKDTGTLADSIIFLTASLHGLVLALVFAQEQVNIVDLRQTSAHEAGAIANVFYDLDRFEPGGNLEARRALAGYVQIVIEEEWTLLQDGQLSQRAWDLWDDAFNAVLDLDPTSPRQEALRDRMLEDIGPISESRNIRVADASSGVTGLFWMVALPGVFFVVIPYFVIRASLLHFLLLGCFAAYNGLVMFTIFVMSNPYSPPFPVEPDAFKAIFNQDMLDLLR